VLQGERREVAPATIIQLDFTLQLDNSLPGYTTNCFGGDEKETFAGCPLTAVVFVDATANPTTATAAPGVAVVSAVDATTFSYAMGGVSPADDIHQLYGCPPTQDGKPGPCNGLFPALAAKFPHCNFGLYGEVNNNASCSLKVHLTLALILTFHFNPNPNPNPNSNPTRCG
jgi:hypothetical protein